MQDPNQDKKRKSPMDAEEFYLRPTKKRKVKNKNSVSNTSEGVAPTGESALDVLIKEWSAEADSHAELPSSSSSDEKQSMVDRLVATLKITPDEALSEKEKQGLLTQAFVKRFTAETEQPSTDIKTQLQAVYAVFTKINETADGRNRYISIELVLKKNQNKATVVDAVNWHIFSRVVSLILFKLNAGEDVDLSQYNLYLPLTSQGKNNALYIGKLYLQRFLLNLYAGLEIKYSLKNLSERHPYEDGVITNITAIDQQKLDLIYICCKTNNLITNNPHLIKVYDKLKWHYVCREYRKYIDSGWNSALAEELIEDLPQFRSNARKSPLQDKVNAMRALLKFQVGTLSVKDVKALNLKDQRVLGGLLKEVQVAVWHHEGKLADAQELALALVQAYQQSSTPIAQSLAKIAGVEIEERRLAEHNLVKSAISLADEKVQNFSCSAKKRRPKVDKVEAIQSGSSSSSSTTTTTSWQPESLPSSSAASNNNFTFTTPIPIRASFIFGTQIIPPMVAQPLSAIGGSEAVPHAFQAFARVSAPALVSNFTTTPIPVMIPIPAPVLQNGGVGRTSTSVRMNIEFIIHHDPQPSGHTF